MAIINWLEFYQLYYIIFCALPSAILTGMIAQRYGARKCGVLGSVLFSGGLLTSWFATSTIFLQVSFGIVSGKNFNPLKSNGRLAHFQVKSYWVDFFFISIQILIEYSVSEQMRPQSDAAFCGVCSRSALFAYVPQKGLYAKICSCIVGTQKNLLNETVL